MSLTPRQLVLQPRDLNVLQGLFEMRLMTRPQLGDLYFNGNQGSARQRIRKLKNAGYIAERPGRKPYARVPLYLTKKGYLTLRKTGLLGQYPIATWKTMRNRPYIKDTTLLHELELMDVCASFVHALQDHPEYQLEQLSTWTSLFAFYTFRHHRRVTIRPDGFVCLMNPSDKEIAFFIEYDRGTEQLKTLLAKVKAYYDYSRSGRYASWRKTFPGDHHHKPAFRLLFIVKSEYRRKNIAVLLLKHGFRQLVWIAVFEDAIRDPLGPIWQRPSDYAEAELKGCRLLA